MCVQHVWHSAVIENVCTLVGNNRKIFHCRAQFGSLQSSCKLPQSLIYCANQTRAETHVLQSRQETIMQFGQITCHLLCSHSLRSVPTQTPHAVFLIMLRCVCSITGNNAKQLPNNMQDHHTEFQKLTRNDNQNHESYVKEAKLVNTIWEPGCKPQNRSKNL